MKTGCPQMVVHLVAPTIQEKAAWISDISQVLRSYLIYNILIKINSMVLHNCNKVLVSEICYYWLDACSHFSQTLKYKKEAKVKLEGL